MARKNITFVLMYVVALFIIFIFKSTIGIGETTLNIVHFGAKPNCEIDSTNALFLNAWTINVAHQHQQQFMCQYEDS